MFLNLIEITLLKLIKHNNINTYNEKMTYLHIQIIY